MSDFFIAPIVEGHGEVQAVPLLLRRILEDSAPGACLRVNPPPRVKAGSFMNDKEYFAKYFAGRLWAADGPRPSPCAGIASRC